MSVLDVLLEGFDDAKHPRGPLGRWVATFHHSVHGRTTSPIEARSAEEAWSKAEEHARASSGRTAQMTVQSVEPLPVASSRVRGAMQVDAQIAAGKRRSRPRVRGDGRSGPIAPSSPARRKPGKSSPLDEVVSFGGIPTRLGDVIAQLQREGHPQAYIDRYVQGLARGRAARSQEATPLVLGALLDRDFSAERRRKLASSGAAMKDGSFPIENAGDLSNAVQAVGRASSPDAAKAHIRKRAKALGLTSRLPDGW